MDQQDQATEQDVFYSLYKAHRKLVARAAYNGTEKPFQTTVIYMLETTTVLWFNYHRGSKLTLQGSCPNLH